MYNNIENMIIDILTLFPEMFETDLGNSISKLV